MHSLGLACPNLAEHNSHFNYTFSGNGSTAPLCTYLTQLPIYLWCIYVEQCDIHVYGLLWVGISIPLRFVVLRCGSIHVVGTVNGLVVKWYIIEHFVIHYTIHTVQQQHNTITIPVLCYIYICNVYLYIRVLPSILRLLCFAMLWFGGLLRSVSLNKRQGVAHAHCTMTVQESYEGDASSRAAYSANTKKFNADTTDRTNKKAVRRRCKQVHWNSRFRYIYTCKNIFFLNVYVCECIMTLWQLFYKYIDV